MQTTIRNIVDHLNWDDLRIVLCVARQRSIRAAALKLKMTESTISRKVSRLEKEIGIDFFLRESTGMRVSPAGEKILGHLVEIEGEIETGLQSTLDNGINRIHPITLTSVPTICNQVLIPKISTFLEEHPSIQLELIPAPQNLSIFSRETDIALRFTKPDSDHSAITRKICELSYGIYYSTYQIQDAQKAQWINYGQQMQKIPIAEWISEQHGNNIHNLSCNDAESILATLRSLPCISALPKIVANKHADLKEVYQDSSPPNRELWLIVHSNLRNDFAVRRVIEWVLSVFSKDL